MALWKRILAVFGICIFLSVAQRTIKLDDAFIYARYVHNALLGHGLVFNQGERVNALTSPMMGYSLVAASWLLGGRILLAEMILSTAFFIGACSLAEYLAPFAGMLIASTAYFYSCYGMETSLFLLMLTLCVLLYVKERYFWLPLVCTLTTLTRFEGGLLALILLWRVWQDRRMPSWKAFVAPAACAAAYLTFNLSYYGRFLPSSTTAKMLHGKSGLWGKWPAFIHTYPELFNKFRLSPYIIPCAVILAFIAAWKLKGSRLNKSVLPFVFGLFAFYILFNIPNYYWYCAPFAFFGLFYAVQALPMTRTVQIILLLVVMECAVTGWIELYPLTPIVGYERSSQWFNQNTRPDARIAAIEIGTIGWNTNRYIDDIAGLTNPKNAVLLSKHDEYSWLEQDRPDYVVVHPAWPYFAEIAAVKSPLYRPVEQFDGVQILERADEISSTRH